MTQERLVMAEGQLCYMIYLDIVKFFFIEIYRKYDDYIFTTTTRYSLPIYKCSISNT